MGHLRFVGFCLGPLRFCENSEILKILQNFREVIKTFRIFYERERHLLGVTRTSKQVGYIRKLVNFCS